MTNIQQNHTFSCSFVCILLEPKWTIMFCTTKQDFEFRPAFKYILINTIRGTQHNTALALL